MFSEAKYRAKLEAEWDDRDISELKFGEAKYAVWASRGYFAWFVDRIFDDEREIPVEDEDDGFHKPSDPDLWERVLAIRTLKTFDVEKVKILISKVPDLGPLALEFLIPEYSPGMEEIVIYLLNVCDLESLTDLFGMATNDTAVYRLFEKYRPDAFSLPLVFGAAYFLADDDLYGELKAKLPSKDDVDEMFLKRIVDGMLSVADRNIGFEMCCVDENERYDFLRDYVSSSSSALAYLEEALV